MRYIKAIKHAGTCRACGHSISESQQYAEWDGAGYSTPKLHRECVKNIAKYFDSNQSTIERKYKSTKAKIAAVKAKKKADMVVIKEKREFKKAPT